MSDLRLGPDWRQCFITHVEVTDKCITFSAQSDRNLVNRFDQILDRHFQGMFNVCYAMAGDRQLPDFHVGKYYMFCDKYNHNFYRVLLDAYDYPTKGQSMVTFIDFGYSESVPNEWLFVYAELFCDYPPLAQSYSLASVRPKDVIKGFNKHRITQCLQQFVRSVLTFAIYGYGDKRLTKIYDNFREQVVIKALQRDCLDDIIVDLDDDIMAPIISNRIAIDYNRETNNSKPLICLNESPIGSISGSVYDLSSINISLNSKPTPVIAEVKDQSSPIDLRMTSIATHNTTPHSISESIEKSLQLIDLMVSDNKIKDNNNVNEETVSNTSTRSSNQDINITVNHNKDNHKYKDIIKSMTNVVFSSDDEDEELSVVDSIVDERQQQQIQQNSPQKHIKYAEPIAVEKINDFSSTEKIVDVKDKETNDVIKEQLKEDNEEEGEENTEEDDSDDLETTIHENLLNLCGAKTTVKISNAISAQSMYCQLEQSLDILDSLIKDMTDYYNNLEVEDLTPQEVRQLVNNSSLLASYYSFESQWLRAIAVKQQNEFQISVFYIDIGLTETVEIKDCYRLLEGYKQVTPQAIHCRPINKTGITYYRLKQLESREELFDVEFVNVLPDNVIEVTIDDKILK
ncbi:uncharacterized protein LOC128955114 [Oppia nitens]|uniref:uncharacterized protein LOC128955114 n=1 Tax=Oppia nitens TaxID=1686743 RepID=UPI0023D9EF43|nr:uncharacterized protein LOC128955114 [Oppia nitens]